MAPGTGWNHYRKAAYAFRPRFVSRCLHYIGTTALTDAERQA
jgi:hypothetical protein